MAEATQHEPTDSETKSAYPTLLFSRAYTRQLQQRRQRWESRQQPPFRLEDFVPKKYPYPERTFYNRLHRPHLPSLRCETGRQPVSNP